MTIHRACGPFRIFNASCLVWPLVVPAIVARDSRIFSPVGMSRFRVTVATRLRLIPSGDTRPTSETNSLHDSKAREVARRGSHHVLPLCKGGGITIPPALTGFDDIGFRIGLPGKSSQVPDWASAANSDKSKHARRLPEVWAMPLVAKSNNSCLTRTEKAFGPNVFPIHLRAGTKPIRMIPLTLRAYGGFAENIARSSPTP